MTATTLPVPSSDPKDLLFNAERIDEFVSSSSHLYRDRLGINRLTASGAIARCAAITSRGNWAPATDYGALNVVKFGDDWWISLVQHHSGATFAGDQAAYWRIYQGVIEPESVVNFGAVADGTTVNDAAFSAAETASLTGSIYVPAAALPFKVNFPASYDFSKLYGEGKLLWNGLTLDLAKARVRQPNKTISALLARYSRGENGIGIVAFGDSLTAGVGSTNYAANVGDPNYNSVVDHSWPVLASRTIRQMLQRDYSNGGFAVWNAGYAGQRMDDGWALTNLKSAVLTPYGALAQALLINFGHNDANASAGSASLDYIKQLTNIVMFARSAGLEPALLTVMPCARPRSDSIYREITSMQLEVARALDIEVYDPGRHMSDMIAAYGYTDLFTADGVHCTDAGYNAWSSCIVREIAAPWIIDADAAMHTAVPTWDTRTQGWVYDGAADTSWAAGVTHLTQADGFRVLPRFSPGKNSGDTLAAYFFWSSGRRKSHLVYRSTVPPQNSTPAGGMRVAASNLSLRGFSQGGSAYITSSDAAGWRRSLIANAIEIPGPIGRLAPGLTYATISAGTDHSGITYAGRLDVVGSAQPGGVAETASLSLDAPTQVNESFGCMHIDPGVLGADRYVFPEELPALRNVVSCAGGGTALRMGLSLAEGLGVIIMGGPFLASATGVAGRWGYILHRGIGADASKLYLSRYDPVNGRVLLTAAPTASAQTLGAGAKILVLFGKVGDEVAIRCFDGLTIGSTQLFQHLSTTAATGSTTLVEAPPVAGVAFGGFMASTATVSTLVQIDWATILRT